MTRKEEYIQFILEYLRRVNDDEYIPNYPADNLPKEDKIIADAIEEMHERSKIDIHQHGYTNTPSFKNTKLAPSVFINDLQKTADRFRNDSTSNWRDIPALIDMRSKVYIQSKQKISSNIEYQSLNEESI
ncbi:MAG: hypothetical protein HRT87_05100 [Legionellales bacterium]|nr:hypothetical protein [Legionellales bacterium]